MKLNLEKKLRLIKLSERASDLLVEIIDESLPKTKAPTKRDVEFKEVLSRIYEICPLLSDSYTRMYNYIQKEKVSSKGSYVKQSRKS